MILATGDHVILLGTVPSQNQKDGAEQTAEQIASGRVDRQSPPCRRQARRMSDTQLEQNINDHLPGDLSQSVQVQARNGTVTLQVNWTTGVKWRMPSMRPSRPAPAR